MSWYLRVFSISDTMRAAQVGGDEGGEQADETLRPR